MPPKDRYAPIVLSGTVMDYYDLDEHDRTSSLEFRAATPDDPVELVIELDGEKLVTESVAFERGDVALRPKLDAAGRYALNGGHANYGYSGYFEASVFDGKTWRAFNIRSLPERLRNYASQTEKSAVQERIEELLNQLADTALEWCDRAYELPGHLVPKERTPPSLDTPE